MAGPRYPSVYQINTRMWLTELSRTERERPQIKGVPLQSDKVEDVVPFEDWDDVAC